MPMRRIFQTACVVSALAFATMAHADDAAVAEAQARFKEGLEFADTMKFEEARLKFLQAFVVLKAPAVLFNLATAEQKTGHDVEAIEHYRAFLKTGAADPHITDAMREKAKQNIADLLTKVSQVDIDVPDGAKVSVDGTPLEESPKEPVPVMPGKHTIEAAFSGKVKSVTVSPRVGDIVKAKIDFDDGATEPPPVESESERPLAGWVVPAGLGALGVAGLVAGGVFASASQSSKDDSEALRRSSPGLCASPESQGCRDYDDKRSSAESQATAAWVGYVSGGVLLAASVATFVFWPKSGKSGSPSRGMLVTPLVGVHGGGASLKLSF
jgi:hypothetical protein